MKTSDFDYNLPKHFIAQNPVIPRDHSKLMLYDSANDKVYHKMFFELENFLNKGDILVLNRSKVIPSRIIFEIDCKKCELFLVKKLSKNSYQVLMKPGKYFKIGKIFRLTDELEVKIIQVQSDGTRILQFNHKNAELDQKLAKIGQAPLPPYIKNTCADFSQYQTVYAKEKGSIAAPTAGLHFTENLLNRIKAKGVQIETVLLHVGLGTFLPVKTENVEKHLMHSEYFEIDKKTTDNLNLAKKNDKRIIAVGTTSVRVLESVYNFKSGFKSTVSETDIFIYPEKYKWKVVDALITNFHLPKSTLIMLVSAFLEHKGIKNPIKKLLALYELAKKKNYRFYSFGDAMLII